jgi:hypothetical protein
MNGNKYGWLVALAGVAFVLVVVASFIVIGDEAPDAENPAQEIADYYQDNKSELQVGAFLGGPLAGALLIFFFGYVRKVLTQAETGTGTLPWLAVIGAAIVAVAAAIDSTLTFAMAEAADDIEPESLRTIQAIWDSDFLPFALGFIVLWLSVGISILRSGALPKWLGWVAIVFGIISPTPIFFVGFLGGAIWIVIVSIMLSMRARSGPAAPAPAA